MGDKSGIEWTDATWNPVVGCSVVSTGCTNCYAMKMAARLEAMGGKAGAKYAGLTTPSKAGPVWNGTVRLDDGALDQPLRWKRPRRIFVNSMSDLFHEDLPFAEVARVFEIICGAIRLGRGHVFQILTKRPERMSEYFDWARADSDAARICPAYWPGVWFGVSVEDQRRADERINILLNLPVSLRWISAEPLLGPLDLTRVNYGVHDDFKDCGGHPDPYFPIDSVGVGYTDALRGRYLGGTRTPDGKEPDEGWEVGFTMPGIDWVVAGGEPGPGARPMHPDWVRGLRDQCEAAGVPFLFKQWGEWSPGVRCDRPNAIPHRFEDGTLMGRHGKKSAGRLLDGRAWDDYPETGDG